MGIQNPKFEPHRLRPVEKEPGEDGRLPCSVDVQPMEEEAKKAGFSSAMEWYSYSTSGHLKDPKLVNYNF